MQKIAVAQCGQLLFFIFDGGVTARYSRQSSHSKNLDNFNSLDSLENLANLETLEIPMTHIYKTREESSCWTTPLLENGGYLLSHKRSTIGAVGLNFSVRNGKRWNPDTITT